MLRRVARQASIDRVPGQVLLDPLVLLSVAVLVVNDHYLKHHVGGPIAGKLSDVVGLFFFPLVLLAVLEWARWVWRRDRWAARPAEVAGAVGLTAAGFAAVKLLPAAGTAYVVTVGALRWAGESIVSLAAGSGLPSWTDVHLSPDASDLLALPVLVVSYLVAAGGVVRRVGETVTAVADDPLAGGGLCR